MNGGKGKVDDKWDCDCYVKMTERILVVCTVLVQVDTGTFETVFWSF